MYLHWGINDEEKTRKRRMSKLNKERQSPETWLVQVMWLPEINGWKCRRLMSAVPSGKPQVPGWLADVQVRKTTGISLRSTLCTGKGFKLAPHNCPWPKDPPPTSKTSQSYQTSLTKELCGRWKYYWAWKEELLHACLWLACMPSSGGPTQLYGGHP